MKIKANQRRCFGHLTLSSLACSSLLVVFLTNHDRIGVICPNFETSPSKKRKARYLHNDFFCKKVIGGAILRSVDVDFFRMYSCGLPISSQKVLSDKLILKCLNASLVAFIRNVQLYSVLFNILMLLKLLCGHESEENNDFYSVEVKRDVRSLDLIEKCQLEWLESSRVVEPLHRSQRIESKFDSHIPLVKNNTTQCSQSKIDTNQSIYLDIETSQYIQSNIDTHQNNLSEIDFASHSSRIASSSLLHQSIIAVSQFLQSLIDSAFVFLDSYKLSYYMDNEKLRAKLQQTFYAGTAAVSARRILNQSCYRSIFPICLQYYASFRKRSLLIKINPELL